VFSFFRILCLCVFFYGSAFAAVGANYGMINEQLLRLFEGSSLRSGFYEKKGIGNCGVSVRADGLKEWSSPLVRVWICNEFITDCATSKYYGGFRDDCEVEGLKVTCPATDCDDGRCTTPGKSLSVGPTFVEVDGLKCSFAQGPQ
jgi:hypothetical protein